MDSSAGPPVARDTVSAAHRSAKQRWPEVSLDEERFHAYVAERTAETQGDLRGIDLESLFLCCACVDGDPAACRAFDARYRRTIRDAIARVVSSADFVDEATATCFNKLLTGTTPRLSHYGGQGKLRAWLKTTATRVALDSTRRHKRVPEEPLVFSVAGSVSTSPESQLFYRKHAADIIAALDRALAELRPDERSLLRMHYGDGLSIDAIGDLRGTHRSTAARGLQRIRSSVERTVVAILTRRLGLDSEEIASLVRGTRALQEVGLRKLFHGETDEG